MKAIDKFYDLIESEKAKELKPNTKEVYCQKYFEMFSELEETYRQKGMTGTFLSFINYKTLANSQYLFDFLKERTCEMSVGDDYERLNYLVKNLDAFLKNYVIIYDQNSIKKMKMIQFYALKPAKSALDAKEKQLKEERIRREAIDAISDNSHDYSIYRKIGNSPFESKLRSMEADIKPKSTEATLRAFEVNCHYPVQVFNIDNSEMIDIIEILNEVEDFHKFFSPSEFPVFSLNFEYMRNLLIIIQNRLLRYYNNYQAIEPYCRQSLSRCQSVMSESRLELDNSRYSVKKEEQIVRNTIGFIDLLDYTHLKLSFRLFKRRLFEELRKIEYLNFVSVLSNVTNLSYKRRFFKNIRKEQRREDKFANLYKKKIVEKIYYTLFARVQTKKFKSSLVSDFRTLVAFEKMKKMLVANRKRKQLKEFSNVCYKNKLVKKVFKSIRYTRYLKKYYPDEEILNKTEAFHNRYNIISNISSLNEDTTNEVKKETVRDNSELYRPRNMETINQVIEEDHNDFSRNHHEDEVRNVFNESISARGFRDAIDDPLMTDPNQIEGFNSSQQPLSPIEKVSNNSDLLSPKNEYKMQERSVNHRLTEEDDYNNESIVEIKKKAKRAQGPTKLNQNGESYGKRELDHTLEKLSSKINSYLDSMRIDDSDNNFKRNKREFDRVDKVSLSITDNKPTKITNDVKQKRFADLYTESERELDDLLTRAMRTSKERSKASSRIRKTKTDDSQPVFSFTQSVSREAYEPSFKQKKNISRIEFDVFS